MKRKIRVTFRAEVYITADTLAEASEKFDSASLLATDTGIEGVDAPTFVETVSVENADTYEDITQDFERASIGCYEEEDGNND